MPLRHQALQPSPDAWIRTPSPPSSRTISPTTSIRGGGFSRTSGHYSSYVSFSAVMEDGKGPPLLQEEQGFGRRWLRWMHRNGVKHWVVPCTLLASVLVRWCIGLGSYSGMSPASYLLLYEMTSSSHCIQGRGLLPCLETTRLKGIGWSSRTTCQRDSGTRTICNIGVWTTPR